MPIIKTRDLIHQTNVLAAFLPNDRLFEAKHVPDTVLRTILRIICREFYRSCLYIENIIDNFLPSKTSLFIRNWENSVGIPDDCFDGRGDLETRRLHILCKLIYMNATTLEDFVSIAEKLGYRIEVIPGGASGNFPYTFPMVFYESVKIAKFTMFVKVYGIKPNFFPLSFPIVFKTVRADLLECVLNKIKPANVNLIVEYIEE